MATVRGCSVRVGHDLQTRLIGFRLCVERKLVRDVVLVDVALSEGYSTVRCLAALPRGLHSMGRMV
jgi:hypothetical protein